MKLLRKLTTIHWMALAAISTLGNANAQAIWSSAFADSHGWNHPEYGTTMMYGDLNGDGLMDVCGRGVAGITCALNNGTSFGDPITASASTDFSDQTGWNNPIFYTSIRLGDVNGDGLADVCGRGYWGISCALGKGDGTFDKAILWTLDYGNPGGWGFLQYGSTIMLGDLNGDGKDDVCARGGDGIWCALSTGGGFSPSVISVTDFSDPQGWFNQSYFSSLRLADVNGDGDADVCGRGPDGILCALGKGDGHFAPAQKWTSAFSDITGWKELQYGSTIMFGDINGDGVDDVCGRGVLGIYCALSTGKSFGPVVLTTLDYSDHGAWNQFTAYYGSLRLADITAIVKLIFAGADKPASSVLSQQSSFNKGPGTS